MAIKTGKFVKIDSCSINGTKYYIVCSKRKNIFIQSFRDISQAIEIFEFLEFRYKVLHKAYDMEVQTMIEKLLDEVEQEEN